MRNLFVIIAALFAVNAQAETVDWMTQLENYRVEVKAYSAQDLFWGQFGNYTKAGLGCTGAGASTVIAFVTDTIPLTNPVAEWVGNKANARYETYQAFWRWETLANVGRGATGGALMAGYEGFEWIVLWLKGDTTQAFSELAKVYASTFATAEAMFAKEGACLMNVARVAVVRAEYRRREGLAPTLPFTPMHQPR